jgi:hypothetical protein
VVGVADPDHHASADLGAGFGVIGFHFLNTSCGMSSFLYFFLTIKLYHAQCKIFCHF